MLDYIFIAAQLFGALAFLLGMVSFYQKSDVRLLNIMIFCNLAYFFQYLLLDAFSSALMIITIIMRLLLAKYYPHDAWLYLLSFISIVIYTLFGEPMEIFVLSAIILGNVVYFKLSGVGMRVGLIIIQFLYVPVTIYYEAYFALASTMVMTVILTTTIYRLKQQSKLESV